MNFTCDKNIKSKKNKITPKILMLNSTYLSFILKLIETNRITEEISFIDTNVTNDKNTPQKHI